MRAMSATLEAAAKRLDCRPEVLVRFADLPCERPRLALTELYAGAEGDQPHAATVTPAGTVLRLRTSASGGSIYQGRVTDLASAAEWAAWTTAPGFAAGSPPRLALAADAATGKCWRYVVGGLGEVVYYATSTDDGASWSGWAQAFDAGAGSLVVGLAAWSEGGVDRLAVAVNPGGGASPDNYLAMLGCSGGVWGLLAETARDHPPIDGIGMGLNAAGDLYVVIAEGPPSRLAFREFALATGEWAAGGVIVEAGAGSVVSFAEPRYRRLVAEDRALISYVEKSSAPSYARALVAISPVRWWLTEEVPWRHPTTRGVEVLRTAADWLFVASDRAHRAPRYAGGFGERLDVPGERVVALDIVQRIGEPGRLRLLIENSGGRYLPGEGAAACVRPGAQVGLWLGYRTAAGVEGVWLGAWWVERVGREVDGGAAHLVVEARDPAGELSALRARRQYQWTNATLGDVLQRCWWRVCGRAESSPHGNLALVVPSFAVAAGERWGDAVERLGRMTGTLVRWRNASPDGVGWEAASPEVVDLGQGASVWAFGVGGGPILGGSLLSGTPAAQRVEAFGAGHWAEHRDWASVESEWRDTGERIVDLKLDAPAEVADRAAWEWRRVALGGFGGNLRARPMPGLEVGDVATVTDPAAGLQSASRAVVGIRTRLDRRRGVYEQEIELGGGRT